MVSRETLPRYATRSSETNTIGMEFDSKLLADVVQVGGEGEKHEGRDPRIQLLGEEGQVAVTLAGRPPELRRHRLPTVVRGRTLTIMEVTRKVSGSSTKQPMPLTSLALLRSELKATYGLTARVQPLDLQDWQKNSMRQIMRPMLLVAQCFALCPVQGVTSSNVHDLRFSWRSARVVYSLVAALCMLVFVVLSFIFYLRGHFNFETSGSLVFYLLGFLCCVVFLRLAGRWPQLEKVWQQVEQEQISYRCPQHLHLKIKLTMTATLIVALLEHLLAKYTVLSEVAACSRSYADTIRRYYLQDYQHVFLFVRFSFPVAVLSEIINIFASFYWNFIDLFVAIVSIALSSRFSMLNKHLASASGKLRPELFWKAAREDYNRLSGLTKLLDSCVSGMVLLSFATNMIFICQQLYNTLRRSVSTTKLIYFFVSFGYMLFRTMLVSICAADIYEESRAARTFLYSVPSESYKLEVHRFLVQISTDTVALTGLRFFTVTRTLLLTLGGTVVTYVVVMVQFSTNSDEQYMNTTDICHDISD
ncbi:gustatory receptor for sugar taste 64f-like [Periplaneta americana]|uniref:gustatory receptor for sugar taste 64f-like n=1 Tax=Periplaneta americana TaxID=6978 RepID=UPI0037E70BD6